MANVITVLRIALVPAFFFLLLGARGYEPLAFFIFIAAALTDLFDGYIARRVGRVTRLGRLADPFADRLLIVGAIVALYFRGAIPAAAFLALLGRDLVLVLGYVVLRVAGRQVPQINLFGKVTNFYLMVAISLLVFQVAFAEMALFSWVFYVGVLIYLVSGLVYIVQSAQTLLGWRAT